MERIKQITVNPIDVSHPQRPVVASSIPLTKRAGKQEARRLHREVDTVGFFPRIANTPSSKMSASAAQFLMAIDNSEHVKQIKTRLGSTWAVDATTIDGLAREIEIRAAMSWVPERQPDPIRWWRSGAMRSLRQAVLCEAARERGCTPLLIRSCVAAMNEDGMVNFDTAVDAYIAYAKSKNASAKQRAEYRRRLQTEWTHFLGGRSRLYASMYYLQSGEWQHDGTGNSGVSTRDREIVRILASAEAANRPLTISSAEDEALGDTDPMVDALGDALSKLSKDEQTLVNRWMSRNTRVVLPEDLLNRLREHIVELITN